MNSFDVIVVLSLLAAGFGGFRLGFLARVASWTGLALGFIVAARVLPPVLRSMEGGEPGRLLFVALGILVGGSFLGQALGLLIGSRMRFALPLGPARLVDRAAGALVGVVGVIVAVWLLLPVMVDVRGWFATQTRTSTIAAWVHDRLPEPPDTLATLRRVIGDDQFPRVFEAWQPAPDVGPPPAESGLTQAVVDAVVPSTVKVSGVACRRVQEGSGFVVAPDLVVTNAHVVAGERSTVVQRSDGSQVDARVVAFDPNRDLAILATDGIDRPPLPLGDVEEGGVGAVFGHPGGGPLEVRPFQVADQVIATGTDIYDRNRTERDVLILSSALRSGDSGGALVDASGAVVGVAFAIAPDEPGVAYALTVEELEEVLAGDLSRAVDPGPCLR